MSKFTIYILQNTYLYKDVHPNYIMSYIEIKKIGGKKYRYKRTSYRIGNKIKHKSEYLSPVKPINKTKKRKIKCIKK